MKGKQKFYALIRGCFNYKPVIVKAADEPEAWKILYKNASKLEVDPNTRNIMWYGSELLSEKEPLFKYYQKYYPAEYLETAKNREKVCIEDSISKAVLRRACDGMIDWASNERTEENLPDIEIEYYSGYINAIEDVLYAIDHEGEWQDKEFLERCKEEELRSKK